MSRRQCPWCGRNGPYVDLDRDLREPWAQPHADGSSCVCRHVDGDSRIGALLHGGRYWDGARWVCVGCGTAPPATADEQAWLDEMEERWT